MCGIAGIIYRNPSHYSRLGADLLALIQPLESRGPDSSGIALYSAADAQRADALPQRVKIVLRGDADWDAVVRWLQPQVSAIAQTVLPDGCLLNLELHAGSRLDPPQFIEQSMGQSMEQWLRHLVRQLCQQFPAVQVSSTGQSLEIYKEVGAVANLGRKYGLQSFSGSHGIAHTRMATESVVDMSHCHPFTPSLDLSIVHNGQISNYYKLKFQLERVGMVFDTHNDSEAIAHYLHYQLLQGHDLETALKRFLDDVDGTYTFLVATPDQVALVRDRYAAKPAVIYESDDRVAIASEYRALLQLPGFDPTASIREPDAGEINVWSVVAAPRALQAV